MAMSCTWSATKRNGLLVGSFAFTSASNGSATGTSPAVYGIIRRISTNPGAAAPTDDWDFTLTDADGIDVAAAQGANRDTANSEHTSGGVPLKDGTTTTTAAIAVGSALTLNVTNAGDTKDAVVTLYIETLD